MKRQLKTLALFFLQKKKEHHTPKYNTKRGAQNMNENKKKKVIETVRFLCICLVIIMGALCARWIIGNNQIETIKRETASAIATEHVSVAEEKESITKYKVKFDELKKKNEDTVAYLAINNTDIAYIVVQKDNNEYYRTHDFSQKYNNAGWIFADCQNNISNLDDNTVIYGYNKKDGSMFANLNELLYNIKGGNYKTYNVSFITENAYYEGYIFAIYMADENSKYDTINFDNENDKKIFVDTAAFKSSKSLAPIDYNSKILTLVTDADKGKRKTVAHIILTKTGDEINGKTTD